MVALPNVGTRVSVRYRLPPGSEPPLTDVVGHLEQTGPRVRVRAKTGEVVEFAAADVLTVRRLTDVPVRNSQIRAVEHAAALAWPGVEQTWLDGWLMRAGSGSTRRANSAIPLDINTSANTLPAIVDWYAQRGLTPLLAIPDRLLPLPLTTPTECEVRMLVCDLPSNVTQQSRPDPNVTLQSRPSREWLATYDRDVPVEVLTAVVDGDVTFGCHPGVAVGRAAVTPAPDGTRWVGLSALRVAQEQRGRGYARSLCQELLSWGTDRAATRAYVQVLDGSPDGSAAALGLFESLGFTSQHRCRYVLAETIWSRLGRT